MSTERTRYDIRFSRCVRGWGYNCVIDGDTFRIAEKSIRIPDLDAPEIHRAECEAERLHGERAANRLRDLLNQGPFYLEKPAFENKDKYDRLLRRVTRDGRYISDILIEEKLARPYGGWQASWCSILR